MTNRDAIATILRDHQQVQSIFQRGCACGDWLSTSDDDYEQHLADVLIFYFPAIADHQDQPDHESDDDSTAPRNTPSDHENE